MATVTDEKHVEAQTTTVQEGTVHIHAAATHIALHHDAVAPEAVGGQYGDMPQGYYRSAGFIGTVIVSVMGIGSEPP